MSNNLSSTSSTSSSVPVCLHRNSPAEKITTRTRRNRGAGEVDIMMVKYYRGVSERKLIPCKDNALPTVVIVVGKEEFVCSATAIGRCLVLVPCSLLCIQLQGNKLCI